MFVNQACWLIVIKLRDQSVCVGFWDSASCKGITSSERISTALLCRVLTGVLVQFNSIQVYLYSAFYDTIVAKQLYRKLSFYNIFIYCGILIYLTYGKIW